jgi:hypothetical protein
MTDSGDQELRCGYRKMTDSGDQEFRFGYRNSLLEEMPVERSQWGFLEERQNWLLLHSKAFAAIFLYVLYNSNMIWGTVLMIGTLVAPCFTKETCSKQ